jgi:hypothetical protein
MKVAVINFSGNVGKSTVAKHLMLPRIKGAEFVAVESINGDDNSSEAVRGKQFGALQEHLMMLDAAVIDVGASNVEDFIKLMSQYRGSHEDFDLYVVPVVKESKQMRDTIRTIEALKAMGVKAPRIGVVFNKLETDDNLEEAFDPIFAYHESSKAFRLKPEAAIDHSELYHRLRSMNQTVDELMNDPTDWKAKLRASATPEERQQAAQMISARRLAASAKENLDAVFAALTRK